MTETDAQGQEVLIEDEGIDHLTEGDEEGWFSVVKEGFKLVSDFLR